MHRLAPLKIRYDSLSRSSLRALNVENLDYYTLLTA
jgi:hypothetical protein